jgi:hypothetical protein
MFSFSSIFTIPTVAPSHEFRPAIWSNIDVARLMRVRSDRSLLSTFGSGFEARRAVKFMRQNYDLPVPEQKGRADRVDLAARGIRTPLRASLGGSSRVATAGGSSLSEPLELHVHRRLWLPGASIRRSGIGVSRYYGSITFHKRLPYSPTLHRTLAHACYRDRYARDLEGRPGRMLRSARRGETDRSHAGGRFRGARVELAIPHD